MAEESNGAALPELCSKCGERPQHGSHSWCRQCRTEAQQRYNAEREKMIEARGFAAGVAALRSSLLAGLLHAHPNAVLKVGEFANYISAAPSPERS